MTIQEILQGVHDWTNGKIVYDISAAHPDGQGNPTPYADLTAALGTGGANIPESLRKGGMSVKFVRSADNKYVQARCMAQNFTTDVAQWQGVDDEPIAGSDNLVKSGGIEKYTGAIMPNGLLLNKENIGTPSIGTKAVVNGHVAEYSADAAKIYDKKYKAVASATEPNEFTFQGGYLYAGLNKNTQSGVGVVEYIPVALEHAVFGEADGNGNRYAQQYRLSLYFNESGRISNSTNQRIAFFDAQQEHIIGSYYFIKNLSTPNDKKYNCTLQTITSEQALEQAGNATRIYKFTINIAKTTDDGSKWGIDGNGNLIGTFANVKYIGYCCVYSTSRYHSLMLEDDYSLGAGWNVTNDTVDKLEASQNNFGKAKMWTTVEDGENVLNISTQL